MGGNGTQFDGIGFAAGVVTGARSFKIDKLGRLTGVAYEKVWRPGENGAECLKVDDSGASYYIKFPSPSYQGILSGSITVNGKSLTPTWTPATVPSPVVESELPKAEVPKKPKKPKHSFDTCSCGFYGYYDGSNDYYQSDLVSGVVEGYGEVVIGTRGFRAMKSRIIALHLGSKIPSAQGALIRRNYAEIPMFDSFKSMIAAFPTDAGDLGINPDNDEDFWTRSI